MAPGSRYRLMNYQLTGLVRDHHGRAIHPTASVMDSQSVKTSTNVPPPTQGTDAGKRSSAAKTLKLGLLAVLTCPPSADVRHTSAR